MIASRKLLELAERGRAASATRELPLPSLPTSKLYAPPFCPLCECGVVERGRVLECHWCYNRFEPQAGGGWLVKPFVARGGLGGER